jgi:hypothetical protein
MIREFVIFDTRALSYRAIMSIKSLRNLMKTNQLKRCLFLLMSFSLFGNSSFAEDVGKCVQGSVRLTLKERLAQTIEKRLTSEDPWEFSPEQEARFKAIFENPHVSETAKPRMLFDALIEARLQSASPMSRGLIRRMAADALEQKSLYSQTIGRVASAIIGPHYNQVLNRVAMRPFGRDDIRDLIVAFHEIEHGFDRNTNPGVTTAYMYARLKEAFMVMRTPFSPALVYRAESRAMGSQWELVRRIPAEQRKVLIQGIRAAYLEDLVARSIPEINQQLEKGKIPIQTLRAILEKTAKSSNDLVKNATDDAISNAFVQILTQSKLSKGGVLKAIYQDFGRSPIEIALASLEYANLTRDEFLKKVAPIQGYTATNLLTKHYKFGTYKKLLLASSLCAAYPLFVDSDQRTTKQNKVTVNNIPANDIRWLTKLYMALFAPDKSG